MNRHARWLSTVLPKKNEKEFDSRLAKSVKRDFFNLGIHNFSDEGRSDIRFIKCEETTEIVS